jgi:hypothetical protein
MDNIMLGFALFLALACFYSHVVGFSDPRRETRAVGRAFWLHCWRRP